MAYAWTTTAAAAVATAQLVHAYWRQWNPAYVGECAAGQYSAARWSVLQGNPKWRAYPGAAPAETNLAIVIHSYFIKAPPLDAEKISSIL